MILDHRSLTSKAGCHLPFGGGCRGMFVLLIWLLGWLGRVMGVDIVCIFGRVLLLRVE